MRRTVVLVLVGLLGAACTPAEPEAAPEHDPELVAAAERLCPVLWEWQKNVGAAMNDMSFDTRREEDPAQRRTLYRRAFSRVRELNAQLDATIVSLPDRPPLDMISPDVLAGIETANAILSDTEAMIDERYGEGTPPGYGDIVPVIFLDLEKVIDVAKPEMATYGDPELIAAFTTVPQCQHGVKDANDGVPRYVP